MNALNYLRLDFLMTKSIVKFFLIIPIIAVVIFGTNSSLMMCLYMFFFLVIAASTPFSIGSNERSDRMYYSFPAKTSSMVLGRYLYLICLVLILWIISIGMILYTLSNEYMDSTGTFLVLILGLISTMICFIQYPIYYKFGLEKGKFITTLIYMIPAFIVFFVPAAVIDKLYASPDTLNRVLNFVNEWEIVLIFTMFIIMIITGIISYLISCRICKNKEI